MPFPKLPLTAVNIRALVDLQRRAGVADLVHFDSRLPGFGIRIRDSGQHSWMVQYTIGRQKRRVVLGLMGALDPSKAFNTAKDLLAQKRLGRDPAIEKAQARAKAVETFGGLLEGFLERQEAKLKPRSYEETRRYLQDYAKPIHPLPVESVERRTLASLLTKIEKTKGATTRNRMRAAMHTYFNWLAHEGYVSANPVGFANKAAEKGARDRVLADDELKSIWTVLGDDDYGLIVKLLVLTAARRDEIGALRWSEVGLDNSTITLPAARTKGGAAHIIPLPEPALAILKARAKQDLNGEQREFVFGRATGPFSGWSQSKVRLDQRIAEMRGSELEAWRLHDLRRSAATGLQRLGVRLEVTEAILNHVAGSRAGVVGIYQRHSWADEKRAALERWGAHIMSVVTGEAVTGKVVDIGKRAR
jgi:integrase